MNLLINRFCHYPGGADLVAGTFGSLYIDNHHRGYTVEQEYNGNKRFISCVPDGTYKLIPFESDRHGKCFVMVNPGLNVYAFESDCQLRTDRYLCLFVHPGSYPQNFEGCCGIGERFITDGNDQPMVINTRQTCAEILGELPRTEHRLIIRSNHHLHNPVI